MRRIGLSLLILSALALMATAPASAAERMAARLRGFEEVPAISSIGNGFFSATLDETAQTITWTMTYGVLNGKITQSHIHFGQRAVNGGIVIFLCSNLGNGPAGTQACPTAPATISGTIKMSDVLAVSGQGIVAGDFGPIVRAIKTGTTYVNIHSDRNPGGEIRGQVVFTP